MNLHLLNQQRILPVRLRSLRRLAERMFHMPETGCIPWGDITVILLNDRGIRIIHQAVFGEDQVTDVITQPYRPTPPCREWSGEIFLNAQRAAEEGMHRAGGPARELALYLIHGGLHLAGETDEEAIGRARMRRLERTRLWIATREDLLSSLLRSDAIHA